MSGIIIMAFPIVYGLMLLKKATFGG